MFVFIGIRFGLLKLAEDSKDADEQRNGIMNEKALGYAVNGTSGCTVGILLAVLSSNYYYYYHYHYHYYYYYYYCY